MTLGPVEVVVIAFPGNRSTGGIVPELERLTSQGVVSVIDGLLVSRDGDGSTSFVELSEVDPGDDAAALAGVRDQLQRLADLKADGVLDDAESAAAKAKLLNG